MQSFRLAQQALEKAIDEANPENISQVKLFLVSCYLSLANYQTAMQYALDALHYFEQIEDYLHAANCLNHIGSVYNFMGDHESRLKTNLKCLKYRRKAYDEKGEIGTLNNIGDTYIQLQNFPKALYYFNLCLSMPYITERSKTIVTHNIGETHFFNGAYKKAIPYLSNGLALAQQTDYKSIQTVGNIFLAKSYLNLKQAKEAKPFLEQAEQLSKENNDKESLVEVLHLWSEYYEQLQDDKQSYYYLKKHLEHNKALFTENNIKQMQQLQMGFEVQTLKDETQRHKDRNKELMDALHKIEQQKNQIATFNKELNDSINYAKRIQDTLLIPHSYLTKMLDEFEYFYLPRDIVSGDFYWSYKNNNQLYFALADCTGHGVPGAFMSILGISSINEIVSANPDSSPADILNKLQDKILYYLTKHKNNRDGMDIFMLKVDTKQKTIEYAGANNSMYLVTERNLAEGKYQRKLQSGNNNLYEIRGDKQPIGYFEYFQPFKNFSLEVKSNDKLYLFTDGYADQFGGPKGKKMMVQKLKKYILSICEAPMEQQKQQLLQHFFQWKGDYWQIDDVSAVLLKV